MGAKDRFHAYVRAALEADGWIITHDPLRLRIGSRRAYIDLGAEMPLAAEKNGRKIAVEIKSFLGDSDLDNLENALGQYGVYRAILSVREPDRALYLAVPASVRDMLEEKDIRIILREFHAKLIVYNPKTQGQLEWIEPTTFE